MHISDFVDNWFHALMIKSPSNYMFLFQQERELSIISCCFIVFLSQLEAGSTIVTW